MLLIYDDEKTFAKMTQADLGRMYAEYGQFTQEIKASGNHVASSQLQPVASATSVPIRDGKRTSDGRSVRGNARAARRILPDQRRDPGRGDRHRRREDPLGASGHDRGPADRRDGGAYHGVDAAHGRAGEQDRLPHVDNSITVRVDENCFNRTYHRIFQYKDSGCSRKSASLRFWLQLASEEINLLAFSAVPDGPNHVELTIFPDKGDVFQALAETLGWSMTGPQHACLVQGDDHLGALAEIQKKLVEAGVSIYASSGVTDGNGHFGYVIYFKEGDHEIAAKALGA